MNAPYKHFHRIAWLATALALAVIVFGAFVRLSNAGLSCPDWPTCYGKATWPVHAEEIAAANQAFPQRPVERHKAPREQLHRHLAAVLGMLVLTLATLATRQRRAGLARVLGACAAVAVAIPLYMTQQYLASSVLTAAALAALVVNALSWDDRDFARIATLTLAVIIVQAMLGMWTVTWLLKPVVVAHLLGGLTTFALLAWMAWRSTPRGWLLAGNARVLTRLGWLTLAVLALQIALGGWVSANYAALACGTDFPRCLGQWWPETAFGDGFVLWRGVGVDYEGGVLDAPARSAIQLAHRLFALVAVAHVLWFAWRLLRAPGLAAWAWALLALLAIQIGLGIASVRLGLPLTLATLHNSVAALLVFVLVTLLARLRAPQR